MKTVFRYALRVLPLIAIIAASVGVAYPSLAADPPAITLSGIWRPATQLTTLDTGTIGVKDQPTDDFRYVDAEIYVRTSVPFWTAQVTCTVAPTVLSDYIWDSGASNGDSMDDVPLVVWGPAWGLPGDPSNGYTEAPPQSTTTPAMNTTTGAKIITASRLAASTPLGSNGVTTSLLLATLRYRVKVLAAAATSPLTCTGTFLNRDGNPVLPTVTYLAPPALSISTGFTITGTVSYQGRAAKNNINVRCTPQSTGVPTTALTNLTGQFTISNIRAADQYTCDFYPNITGTSLNVEEPDLYLGAETKFTLNTSYKFLPVVLEGGNLIRSGTCPSACGQGLQIINTVDLNQITANWNGTTPGDVNGDLLTNKTDLAIVTGNLTHFDYINADHIIYSAARTYGTTAPDNRIYVGKDNAGAVTQLIPSTARDFWPAVSDDGTKIAFVRLVGTKYSLFTMNSDGTGTPVQVTPATAAYDSFAPSWSPDGTRIAFTCGTSAGWRLNTANLCVIDVTGRNFQVIASSVKIYPPAWYDNHNLIYAGTPSGITGITANSVCPDTLCTVLIQDVTIANTAISQPSKLDLNNTNIPLGSDMPSYRSGVLIYRYTNGSNRHLRAMEYDGSTIPTFTAFGTTFGNPFHVDVGYDTNSNNVADTAISTQVDYYTLSRDNLNIMYYERSDTTGFGGLDFYNSVFFGNASTNDIRWDSGTVHHIDNVISNPSWNGDKNTTTDIHAQRNSFVWIP